jgi:HAMP domain-containing protein
MDERQTEKRTRFVSLRVKLLVGFTLLFGVVFAGAFYWFDAFAKGMAMRQIEKDLVKAVRIASIGVDGDELIALFNEGVRNEDGLSDDPRYWQQVEWLQEVEDIDPHAWAYTYVKGDRPGEIIFIADVAAMDEPDKAAKFLEVSPPAEGESEDSCTMCQGLTKLTLEMEPYTDKWGTWVSAFAPVENSKGEKVTGLGVDFSAEYVSEVRQRIWLRVMGAFVVVYFVLFIMALLVSETLTRPVIALTRAAERIGEGDYEQELPQPGMMRFPDEVSTLAEVFQIMVGKVYRREQALRRQVEELRIEIDEVKRKKQVEEIVDTDFFQDLQVKARTMRSRKQGGERGATPESES